MSQEEVPKTQNIPPKNPENKPFFLRTVNYMLYQGLSKHFGIGEETREGDQNRLILKRHLDPDNPLVGSQAKIYFKFHKGTGLTYFELYTSIYHEDPELEIVGGPMHGGVWTSIGGDLMAEKLRAQFHVTRGLDLQSPSTLLIGRTIEAAGELAKNPNCKTEDYWTAKRQW